VDRLVLRCNVVKKGTRYGTARLKDDVILDDPIVNKSFWLQIERMVFKLCETPDYHNDVV